uniref:Uncharacterized protein n=1 Tax=Arundo donax TaxID=35708 RepID=A0A0A9CDL1_ARUDO
MMSPRLPSECWSVWVIKHCKACYWTSVNGSQVVNCWMPYLACLLMGHLI